jgi:hypothetical protein
MANVSSETMGGGGFVLRKAVDQSRTYDVTSDPQPPNLADDDDLKWDVQAGEVWVYDLLFRCPSSDPGPLEGLTSITHQWALPADTSLAAMQTAVGDNSGTWVVDEAGGSTWILGGPLWVSQSGIIEVGTTGTVAFQWDMGTRDSGWPDADPRTVTVLANSYLRLTLVSGAA